jgi:hypothetical protein
MFFTTESPNQGKFGTRKVHNICRAIWADSSLTSISTNACFRLDFFHEIYHPDWGDEWRRNMFLVASTDDLAYAIEGGAPGQYTNLVKVDFSQSTIEIFCAFFDHQLEAFYLP